MAGQALPVSLYVDVQVVLGSIQAQAPAINTDLILGTSSVIDTVEREREYANITEVATDFGTTAPEYLAALLWFGQNPSPENLFIGRWVNVASPGQLIGGGVTAANLLISAWTGITAGALTISVDGIPHTLSGLNFSAVTNLNGVASVIQTALRSATGGLQTVVYNSTYNNFVVTDDSTGTASTISFAQAPTANGFAAFSGQPTAADTITIDDTVVTFVSALTTGNQVLIAGSLPATLVNLATFLNASGDAGLSLMSYDVAGSSLYITAKKPGAVGNYYSLARSSSAITLSGAFLTGGVAVAGGAIVFAANPSAAATITLDGTVITFVSALTTGNQVLIGGTLAATLAALLTFLNASTDVNLVKMTYGVSDTTLHVASILPGTAGNAYTLAASVATPSAGTLLGGAGTDVSAMMSWLATSSGAYVAPGLAAETAVSAVALFDNLFNTQWYGLQVLGASDADHEQIAAYIEAAAPAHYYGVTTQEAGVLVSTDTSDIAYILKLLGYNHTAVQYSSTNPYAIVSYLARILTTKWLGSTTTITLWGKQEPGVVAETMTVSQNAALKAKNCNAFCNVNNGTAFIQYGTSASGQFTDTVIGADWLAGEVQTVVFDAMEGTPYKIPQTDAGMGILIAAAAGACQLAVNNGYAAPGQWNSTGFGTLAPGQNLPAGFYIYAAPIATQAEATRQARIAPLMQIAVKNAGAIQHSDIVLNIEQ